MRFLLDQGLPRSTVPALQGHGHVADHVGALGMATARDEEILQKARESGAVVVTLDADFHMLLALRQWSKPSVIRVRIEGMKGDQVARVLDAVARLVEDDLQAGVAVSVTASSVRIRRLPLL